MANRKLTIEILGEAKGLSKVFGEAEKGATALGDTVEKSGSKLDATGDKMTKFGAAAVTGAALAGTALLGAAGKFSDLALEASKMSDTTGLAVDDMSRWIEVAGDMGIDAGTLEGSLNKMNVTAGKTPEKFAEFGVEIAKTKDGAFDANQTFLNTVDRLNAIEDPAKKAEAATALLGRGWTSMSELIETGSDSLTTSLAAVSDAKVIDPDEVEQAKDFRAAMDTLKDSIEDLVISIGQGAAPVISTLAETIGGLISGLDAANEATGGMIGKFGVVAVVGVAALGALSMITGQVLKMKTAIGPDGNLGKLVQSMKNMGPAGGAAGIALGAVVVGVIAYKKGVEQAEERTKDLTQSINDFATVSDEAFGDAFQNFIHDAFLSQALDGKSLKSTFDDLASSNIEAARRTLEWAEANGSAKGTIDLLRGAIEGKEEADKNAAATADKYGDSTDGVTAASKAADSSIEDLDRTVGSFDGSLADLSPTMQGYIGDVWSAEAATKAADAAYSALMGKLDAKEAWLNLNESLDGFKTKMAEGTLSTRDQELALIDIQQDLLTYLGSLDDVPPEKETEIIALIDQGKLDEAELLLAKLTRIREARINIKTVLSGVDVSKMTSAATGGADGDPDTELAEGGIVRRRPGGMRAIIGEGRHDEAVIPLPDGWARENGLSYLSGDNVLSNESPGAGARLGEFISMLTVAGENQLATSENVLAASRNELATSENQLTVNEYQWAAGENQLATSENVLAASENGLKYWSGDNVLSNESHGISMLLAQVGNLVTVLGENQMSFAGENQSRSRRDNVIFKGDLIIDNHAAQKIVIADNRFKRGAL